MARFACVCTQTQVEVLVLTAVSGGVDPIVAAVPSTAVVIGHMVLVRFGDTDRILTSEWYGCLACLRSDCLVEVRFCWVQTFARREEIVVTPVVFLAEGVKCVVSLLVVALWVFTVGRWCQFADLVGHVDVSGRTVVLAVILILAMVVFLAFRGFREPTLWFWCNTARVFTIGGGDVRNTFSCSKIQIFSSTISLGVSSIVALEVFVAVLVLEVEAGLASAAGLGYDGVCDGGVLAVQAGTDGLHADPHSRVVSRLDPRDKVVLGEAVASLAVLVFQCVVLG